MKSLITIFLILTIAYVTGQSRLDNCIDERRAINIADTINPIVTDKIQKKLIKYLEHYYNIEELFFMTNEEPTEHRKKTTFHIWTKISLEEFLNLEEINKNCGEFGKTHPLGPYGGLKDGDFYVIYNKRKRKFVGFFQNE